MTSWREVELKVMVCCPLLRSCCLCSVVIDAQRDGQEEIKVVRVSSLKPRVDSSGLVWSVAAAANARSAWPSAPSVDEGGGEMRL